MFFIMGSQCVQKAVGSVYIDLNMVEKNSEHYYIPLPEHLRSILYYPVSVGYFNCKPNYRLQRNSFYSYLLLVMLSGSLTYQTRKSIGVARAGQVLLLDCNTPHSYSAQGRCSFTFVHFDGAQSREIFEEIEGQYGNLIQVADVMSLHESIGEIMNLMREEKRVGEAQTSAMLYNILMQLLDASGSSGSGSLGNTVVDRAIAHIQEHLSEKLTVDTIAQNIGYSPSYFARIFVEETGMSPYQFVVKSRMERAQQLLQTTRIPIQDIAFQTGFNSAANFCYAFRRYCGKTPQQYRHTTAAL